MIDDLELTPDAFTAFFRSFNDGREPFRWQVRLAEQACAGAWPDYITLPTASGKTSCLDIAVFALAHQACRRERTRQPTNAPRRIFFVVDRRIIVSEAFERASKLARFLHRSLNPMAEPQEQESFEKIEPSDLTVLKTVANWLRHLASNQEAPPLDCYELRGGIYRDDAWVRSLLQPTIITSTVDQVGSRLLFRGYGVSDRNLPIHAALTANDSLILLDEAHCSNPFSQTMKAIALYRDAGLRDDEQPRWSEQALRTPFRFVEMTATPPHDAKVDSILRLEDADYQQDAALKERHDCPKLIRLEPSTAKGSNQNAVLAKHLAEHAETLAGGRDGQRPCRRIAIVVNRVACARAVYDILREEKKGHRDRVELMIGRMRPVDRETLTKKLQDRFRSGAQEELAESHFVVATQCLEVGADFDFDGMATQCASLDALRQRFGRLNRLGRSEHSRGVIVMAEGDKAPRKPDPIYGEALPATWQWLLEQAADGTVDFGVRALNRIVCEADSDAIAKLNVSVENAPVLMPAHLDLLCQTAPRPALEPNIAAYLHGPNRGVPEVRVCWRADLPELSTDQTTPTDSDVSQWEVMCHQTLAVCPPSSAECLSVPLPLFKEWLRGDEPQEFSDLLGEQLDETDDESSSSDRKKAGRAERLASRRGVIWNGRQSVFLDGTGRRPDQLFPNALIVLPATAGGWSVLGHVPQAPPEPDVLLDGGSTAECRYALARIDVASDAFRPARSQDILRVHRSLMTSPADKAALNGLWKYISPETTHSWKHSALSQFEEEEDSTADEVLVSEEATANDDNDRSASLRETRKTLAGKSPKQVQMIRYPDPVDRPNRGVEYGFVVVGPRRSERAEIPRASFDDDFDEHNLDADERISLADHLADVAGETQRLVRNIGLEMPLSDALIAAAERHDLGKADLRFQAMLLGSSLDLAAMQPKLWAKSARGAASRRVSDDRNSAVRDTDQLPRGFRHEMLSLQLADRVQDDLDEPSRDVMRHAIAAHHGHARPFAPVVDDPSPPSIDLCRLLPSGNSDLNVSLSESERAGWQAHRLDSGISERFWNLNRRFGWWGLVWLESSLRLADWAASAQGRKNLPQVVLRRSEHCRSARAPSAVCAIPLQGINGTNPLGFLTALGVLRTAAIALPDANVRMKWVAGGVWHPVLMLNQELSTEALTSLLHQSLTDRQSDDHFVRLGRNINVARDEFRRASLQILDSSNARNRTSIDYFAAFGSDALVSFNDGGTIQDTALRTMAGAGHQHFLETMRNLIVACQPAHLEKALFRTWIYDDPTQTLSLRFDPMDDNRYALRWRNPSGDPYRRNSGSMLGANRMAIEAIPFFVTSPGEKRLQTTAFTGYRSDDTFMHWPVWSVPLSMSVVQSLLFSHALVAPFENAKALQSCGITAVFCSQRITVGKVRNFTLGRPKWAALAGS